MKLDKQQLLKERKEGQASLVSPPSVILNQVELSEEVEEGKIDVKVICSTSWYRHYNGDVFSDKVYDSSITRKGKNIPHILDHIQQSTAHVGDVKNVYVQNFPTSFLGFTSDVQETPCLVMETTIREDYNEDVYKFYKNKKINQHSIGYTYVNGDYGKLALNSQLPEDKEQYAVWQEYFPKLINKDEAIARRYFWLVDNIDVVENSCVLFGANPLTPTLAKKEEPVPQPQSRKLNMKTIEELYEELALKEGEITNLKAGQSAKLLKAREEEKGRTLSILEAGKVLAIPSEACLKAIEQNLSSDQAVLMFETIKSLSQQANPTPTSKPTSTLSKETIGSETLSVSDAITQGLLKLRGQDDADPFKKGDK